MPKLRSLIRRCIRRLPPRLRLATDTVIGNLSDVAAHWNMPAFRINGTRLDGDDPVSLIHCGELPQYKSWISNFLTNPTSAEPIGAFSLSQISKRKGSLADSDILLCPITPLSQVLFSTNEWLIVPKYVKCMIDLHKPIEQLLCRHTVKDDLRIARKKGYRFAILRDDASFDEFFHQMLVPTAMVRHEERAHIASPEALRQIFHRGYLLAAYQDNQWVGASLMVPQADNTLNWANIGWRDGCEQLMKDRLVSALLYEMILRGKNEAYDTLDLGSCSPFVNDGPLNYKLKWGARMVLPRLGYEDHQLQGLNAYFAVHFKRTKSLLQDTPLLVKHRCELRAVGWNSRLRTDFRRQIEDGLPWVNLARRD